MTVGNGSASNGKDEITELITEMYDELMRRRIRLMDMRREKYKLPVGYLRDKQAQEIADLEESIMDLQSDYENILKSHSSFLKYNKLTGQGTPSHAEDLKKMIQETKSNMGSIVQTVPKN